MKDKNGSIKLKLGSISKAKHFYIYEFKKTQTRELRAGELDLNINNHQKNIEGEAVCSN